MRQPLYIRTLGPSRPTMRHTLTKLALHTCGGLIGLAACYLVLSVLGAFHTVGML